MTVRSEKRGVFVLFRVVALGLLSRGWLHFREPVDQSRRLSSWAAEMGRSWPDNGRERSAEV